MFMIFKAVIFDLDGTLICTAPDHRYKLVARILGDLGTCASPISIDKFWFETDRSAIIKKDFGVEPAEFWKLFRIYDTVDLRKRFTRPYYDVGVINDIRQKGIKTGIVTGAPLHIADFEIGMLGPDNYDSIIIAHTLNGYKPKPHPHGLEECITKLGVQRHEAIYVGNSDEDTLTAKNAQVLDVIVDRQEYECNIVPSRKINTLIELKPILHL